MAKTVLVVDDEDSILRSTVALLDGLGIAAIAVSDPSRVVATALEVRPDVILQDVRMPGLDLEQLVRDLRAQPELASTPIVLFTADMDADVVAAHAGVSRVLEKPFHPNQLLAALQATG